MYIYTPYTLIDPTDVCRTQSMESVIHICMYKALNMLSIPITRKSYTSHTLQHTATHCNTHCNTSVIHICIYNALNMLSVPITLSSLIFPATGCTATRTQTHTYTHKHPPPHTHTPPISTRSRNSNSSVQIQMSSLNLNFNLYREIPKHPSFSIWWITAMEHFQWKLSYVCIGVATVSRID